MRVTVPAVEGSLTPSHPTPLLPWHRLLCLLVFVAGNAFGQACTTTLSVGADVPGAVANAAVGAVICLNSGNYGKIEFANIVKPGVVTVRSTSGATAKGAWRTWGSRYIKLASLLGSISIEGCSKDITVQDTVGTPNSYEGIYISGQDCPTTVQNIVVDGAVLDRIGQMGYEGRLSIRDGNTVTVRNSQFLGVYATPGTGPSDGIIMVASIKNIMIGPGNVFSGIDQQICNANGGAHCDMVQTYGGPCSNVQIEGNQFKNSSTFILNESKCSGTFRNNVMDSIASGQWHTWSSLDWSHNTVYKSTITFNSWTDFASAGTVKDNTFHDSSFNCGAYAGGAPAACNFSYNTFTSGCQGSNCIAGSPTYSGGAHPSTWNGWLLAAGSIGKANASDGKDRGSTTFGGAAPPTEPPPSGPTPLGAPTNLKVAP